ncbi:MAG: cell division protein FtsZ [Promethearchaeota archaeon]
MITQDALTDDKRPINRKLPRLNGLPVPVSFNIRDRFPRLERFHESGGSSDFLDDDIKLKRILDGRVVRTLLVGVGGAGGNMVSRFQGFIENSYRTVCVNTDVQDLYYTIADEKVLIGKRVTSGLGAGNNYKVGELAALEDKDRLKRLLDADLVFLSCGLGGGTGTGATPILAEIAKNNGAMVVGIVTLPFKMEGQKKEFVAARGLKKLMRNCDLIIPLSNERLLNLVPDMKIHQAFKIMDEILIRSAHGVIELITRPGLVNLDFADVKSLIRDGAKSRSNDVNYNVAIIGMTEISSQSTSKIECYTEKILNNPLIGVNPAEINGVLVGVIGDHELKLRHLNAIISTISKTIDPSANLKWGFVVDPGLKGKLRIIVLGTGCKSPLLDDVIAEYPDV